MRSKYSYWRYIYKLKYFRDSRHEIYWIKAVITFIAEILELEDLKLRKAVIEEIERQLRFQTRYYLDTSYFHKLDCDSESFKKKVIYQILYMSKSQRTDLMRNIIGFLPYRSEELVRSRQFVDAYTLAKNYSRRKINKYYRVINQSINEGRYKLAVQLSARCLREQYGALNYIDYTTLAYTSKTQEYLGRLRNFFDMQGSTWINRYYKHISTSSKEVFQYEDSIVNQYAIADKRMARYSMINLKRINELIYTLKYCK